MSANQGILWFYILQKQNVLVTSSQGVEDITCHEYCVIKTEVKFMLSESGFPHTTTVY